MPVSEQPIAHPDVLISEEFLVQNEELLLFTIYSLMQASMRTHGAVDSDAISALEASVQTYRTLQSGLLYETRADNMIAGGVQRLLTNSLSDYRKIREERDSLSPLRDSDVLTVMVFLQRIGRQNQNGRPRGRMFIDLLQRMTPNNASSDEFTPRILV